MSVASMDYREALRDLDARQPESMPERGLERIQAIAESLNHPELTYPSIQVTGTNGKTTTARMIMAIACAHGLSAGTYVSPHVESVRERIGLCGEDISEQEFAEVYGHLLPHLERLDGPGFRVTYFEALTALAYLWFADKPVDLGVFEVGMGGTWDATNLVRGDVAVLCPVGLDHKELGSTVQEVAAEKAGIIKEGRIAVSREQRPEALDVIEARCKDMDARLVLEGRDFRALYQTRAHGGQVLRIEGIHGSYEDVYLPLFGEQLARNAAASVAACEAFLGRALDGKALRAALAKVTSPGRLEIVGRSPMVLLDGAHNPDAAQALADTLVDEFTWDRLHLVIAVFKDKDLDGVLRPLAPLVSRAYACRNSSPRSLPPERVASALGGLGVSNVSTNDSVASALAAAKEAAGEGDLILVTGSFYTVGDARPLLVGG